VKVASLSLQTLLTLTTPASDQRAPLRHVGVGAWLIIRAIDQAMRELAAGSAIDLITPERGAGICALDSVLINTFTVLRLRIYELRGLVWVTIAQETPPRFP